MINKLKLSLPNFIVASIFTKAVQNYPQSLLLKYLEFL